MLNAILHKGLGATDAYQQHILTDNNGIEYLLLSDGKNSWKIGRVATSRTGKKLGKPVADTLHEWLLKHYRHGLVDGSEPGYDFDRGGFKVSTGQSGSSSRSGSYSSNSGGTTAYVPDANKTTAYNTALLNGKVITLTQVLKSVNPSTHVFYVPVGYYYQGDVSEAPSVSTKDAEDAGDRAAYNKSFFDSEMPTSPSPTTTSKDDDNTMLFLLLPLIALLGTKFMKNNNKRKKR